MSTFESADVAIVKCERFDVEMAKRLVEHPDTSKEVAAVLRRMLKEKVKLTYFDVNYKLGKDCKHEFLGRWCALRGVGLQNLPRDIRNALAHKYYHDVDMVNAQPTILLQYCERRGYDCKALARYINEREALLQELMDYLDIKRWEAKQRVVSILFGASADDLTPFFKDQLLPEVRKVMANVWTEHKSTMRFLANKPNYQAKALSYVLQTEERKCLMAMDRALSKRGRSLDVLMHDGGMVLKLPGETELPQSLLPELQRDIHEETGYDVTLAVKPMETSLEGLSSDAIQAEYQRLKTGFELSYFKLMKPSLFVRLTDDGIDPITYQDLMHQQQNLLLQGKPFVCEWVRDPGIKTYQKLVFSPKKPLPPDCYNLFTGFAVEPKPGADFSPITEVLNLVSGNDAAAASYIEKWVAHIFQKPYEKTKTCIVIQGKQGVGKDTYFNFIGKLLGKQCFYNTNSPENDIFARFNAGTESTLLVKFEEADFTVNKANASKLKSLLTNETANYERKGQDRITLDDYRNYVMTTNQEVPVVLEDQERRFVLVKASDAKKGDFAFWNRAYDAIANPDVQAAYMEHLLSLDLTDFCPFRDRLLTAYYQETAQSFIPYHARFFQRTIEEHVRDPSISWSARVLFNLVKEANPKFDLTETKLGRDLKPYVEAGVLKKTKGTLSNTYTISDPTAMKDFLTAQGRWVDY